MNDVISVPARADDARQGLTLLTHVLYGLHTLSWFSAGIFSVVNMAQRIDTVGGVAPDAGDCNSGTSTNVVKVPYTATYYLYKLK